MAYETFEKGGRKFYRYGTWEIEADLARRTRMQSNVVGTGDNQADAPPVEVEDEQATERELSRIAAQRANDAASAAALNLTTGSQSGYLGGTRRIGRTINTGGGYAGSRMLTVGKTGAGVLGGY